VFAGNDAMAIGCLAAFDALGVAVPGEIAVAGFDGIPLGGFVRPALTTMRVPIVELGRGAVDRLAELIARPDAKAAAATLQPELVIRESCGAKRSRRPRPSSSSRQLRRRRSR
jgi:LacI family transcriptional regulator